MSNRLLTAPKVDYYISIMNDNMRLPTLTQKSIDAIEPLFAELRKIAPMGERGERTLFLPAERGPLEDFGNYKQMLLDEIVENREDYKKQWREQYPRETNWYRFTTIEDPDGYKAVFLNFGFRFECRNDTKGCEWGLDITPLLRWLRHGVRECIGELKRGTYNQRRALELPPRQRFGAISRKALWDIWEDERKAYLADFTQDEISEFLALAAASEKSECPKNGLRKMTSGLFFQCCAWGYAANHYKECGKLSNKELYRKYADGRDDGLCEIDEDSPAAFEQWFTGNKTHGGHPWEVCRGGNSTHVSLYVVKRENCYSFHVAGKAYGRSAETIKFFLTLHHHGMPVTISDAKGLAARLTETDTIGIVPSGVFPRYCDSWFPQDDILDFMNLPWEEDRHPDDVIAKAEWLPLEPAKLL